MTQRQIGERVQISRSGVSAVVRRLYKEKGGALCFGVFRAVHGGVGVLLRCVLNGTAS